MAAGIKVLIAEDDRRTHEEWSVILCGWGYDVTVVEDGEKASQALKSLQPQILLVDLRMPGKSGLELLSEIREQGFEVETIVISGTGDIDDAVQAIKLGAHDYLSKPVDLHRLRQLLRNLTQQLDTRRENRLLRQRLKEVGELGPMYGKSLAMRRVMAAIEQLADSNASVIITGETGTGKELVARTIHELSSRKDGPFVAINCAAIPDTLIESDLFGHEKGAFTGADRRRQGYFEMANGGTLLLDEISEMKLDLQAKLLRVLEEQKIRRVGGTELIDIDVRVLAASNRDPLRAVQNGKLREDLFYRLNVFTIELPTLRQRIEDIPVLAELFLRHYAKSANKQLAGFDDESMRALQVYPWPGNIRQLRNVIERAVVVAAGPFIVARDLADSVRGANLQQDSYLQFRVGTSLEEVEKEMIVKTIESMQGNKTHAAEALGITPKTLYNKLERYGS
jgi:DNA-binding NtrC family response regulator